MSDTIIHDLEVASSSRKQSHVTIQKCLGGVDCYEPEFAGDLEFVSLAESLGHEIAKVPVVCEDYPDSTFNTISKIELGTALIDVHRRMDTISNGPRFRDIKTTPHFNLTNVDNDE